jgi:ribose-phosphate pyrophosphokinase
MSTPILFALPGNEALAPCIATALHAEIGDMEVRHFPDGESYVRLDSAAEGRPVIILATLARPDAVTLPLLYTAMTAREDGARSVGLIAPYLAYMRQDRRFKPGEAVTSRHFAKLISGAFDWLVTVDPHLHRYKNLDEIYSIPSAVTSAAPLMAAWIGNNVENPVIIGPDAESEQWAASVAVDAGHAPYTVLTKVRRGDRDVQVSVPDPKILEGRTPVLVDDIISTAGTMAEAAHNLQTLGAAPPVCVATHGVFAGQAMDHLTKAGVARIVTTNSIAHKTNAIDISGMLADAVKGLAPF